MNNVAAQKFIQFKSDVDCILCLFYDTIESLLLDTKSN